MVLSIKILVSLVYNQCLFEITRLFCRLQIISHYVDNVGLQTPSVVVDCAQVAIDCVFYPPLIPIICQADIAPSRLHLVIQLLVVVNWEPKTRLASLLPIQR